MGSDWEVWCCAPVEDVVANQASCTVPGPTRYSSHIVLSCTGWSQGNMQLEGLGESDLAH